MHLQKVQISIVRSIRQVSLVRNWVRARGSNDLPRYGDFTPDERAGDAADLMIAEVRRENDALSYFCRSSGQRVQQIFGRPMQDVFLHDTLDPALASAAKPIWDSCASHRLPIYAMVPLSDSDGCPVTVEQIFLPYSSEGDSADVIVAAIHAWSTEGRFNIKGLLRGVAKPPLHWAVIIDPALTPKQPADARAELE